MGMTSEEGQPEAANNSDSVIDKASEKLGKNLPKVSAKSTKSGQQKANQFGTFKGVFVPSILTILGVILFLRLGWVVGQAGLASTIVIITISSLITFVTALSISATATNTRVGPGGSYFLVSRCFGLEAGAAIGLPLYCAQALGISFYAVGFAESLKLFFPEVPVTYVAFGTLAFLTILTFLSSNLALKAQTLILVLISLALGSLIFSTPLKPGAGPNEALQTVESFSFWQVFAVFFPAVTGIQSGVSMSGDLKDSGKSLPLGTLTAVAAGYVIYVLFAVLLAYSAPLDQLLTNSLILTEIAPYAILVFLGLWGATLSSALGSLMGAPRTLQALAKDRVLPFFLSQGSGETNEPRFATAFTFIIAAVGLFLGDLNAIASILTMFFLASYGALNLISGLEGLIANPSWRPTFRTPWSVSMFGAALCFGAMFLIDPGASQIALILIFIVYWVMRKRQIQAGYSDIRSGLVTHFTRNLIYKLYDLEKHARNWRPHFLVFSGSPKSRLYLIDLAYAITQKRGFLTVASILMSKDIDREKLQRFETSIREFLRKRKVTALVKVNQSESLSSGARAMIENYGIGNIVPNTIVLGSTKHSEKMDDFARIVFEVFLEQKNILIIKNEAQEGSLEALISAPSNIESIDIWWGGKNNNASLMLTLAYMLKTSRRWKEVKLCLKTLVANKDQCEGVMNNLREFVKASRIPAEVQGYVVPDISRPIEHIAEHSKEASLVFVGMRSPKEDETVESYHDYYQGLLEKTSDLPSIIFTLAGEPTDFHKIFS